MRYETTSQPSPTWDRHLDEEVGAEQATQEQPGEWQGITRVLHGRDLGDEDDGR
jgi:hypothetical protein